MKKRMFAIIGAVLVIIAIVFICATTGDKVMTKEKGVYIVNGKKVVK